MANDFHQRKRSDLRDLDPHLSGSSGLRSRLYRLITSVREVGQIGSQASGEIQERELVAPQGKGLFRVQDPANPGVETILPSLPGVSGFVPGQRVLIASVRGGAVIISGPPAGSEGVDELPVSISTGQGDLLEVQSLNPSSFEQDSTNTGVEIIGAGFSQSPVDTFTSVLKATPPATGWVTDAEITVSAVAWVSETKVTATFTIGADREIDKKVSILPARA